MQKEVQKVSLECELTDAERRVLNRSKTEELRCDHAIEIVAVCRELGARVAVCAEHLDLPGEYSDMK
jgi:hypothetical protein